jgi:hypothetical protein
MAILRNWAREIHHSTSDEGLPGALMFIAAVGDVAGVGCGVFADRRST